MLKGRQGFTLIELLIVVVIIGILAAIAIPKFSATREKAYFSAMKSDLKNLQAQQEMYYSDPANNYQYAPNATTVGLDFAASSGVTVDINNASQTGWDATAAHSALQSTQFCAVFVGDNASVAPATTAGVVTCTGE
ncbi:MAG: type IV pilin protein [Longimicrobiales bacterium]